MAENVLVIAVHPDDETRLGFTTSPFKSGTKPLVNCNRNVKRAGYLSANNS